MAVPGSVFGDRNRGSHALLEGGAKVVEHADDILEEIGLSGSPRARAGRGDAGPAGRSAGVSDRTAKPATWTIWPSDRGWRARALLTRLLDLQLQGFIRRLEGGRFVRAKGKW